MKYTIEHDSQNNRFFCTVENSNCFVTYEATTTTPAILDITHTFVHPDLRGRGIAEFLLKKLTEYARAHGATVKPSCSYAVLYYRRHRSDQDVLATDVDLLNGGSCRIPSTNTPQQKTDSP